MHTFVYGYRTHVHGHARLKSICVTWNDRYYKRPVALILQVVFIFYLFFRVDRRCVRREICSIMGDWRHNIAEPHDDACGQTS